MLITQLVHGLLFPPAILIILLLLGLLFWKRRPGLARGLILSATVALFMVSNPYLVSGLSRAVSADSAISPEALADAQAIVILGGGRRRGVLEYGGGDQVSTHSLLRARYGAWLARRSGLPVLVTGGSVRGEKQSEAELMASLLEEEFRVPVRWQEGRSRTTYENAVNSAALLKADGIERIALVTEALHMRRAVQAFEKQGLLVYPAPTGVYAEQDPYARWWDDVLPRASALRDFVYVAHELVGRLWYRIRYY